MTHTNFVTLEVYYSAKYNDGGIPVTHRTYWLSSACMWVVKSIVAQFWVSLEIECHSKLSVGGFCVSPEIECLWISTCTDNQIPLSHDIYWNINTVPLEFKKLPSCIQHDHWKHEVKILTALRYLNTRTNSHERVRCRGPSNSLYKDTWMSITSQKLLICMQFAHNVSCIHVHCKQKPMAKLHIVHFIGFGALHTAPKLQDFHNWMCLVTPNIATTVANRLSCWLFNLNCHAVFTILSAYPTYSAHSCRKMNTCQS
jgi:hypothetical protein